MLQYNLELWQFSILGLTAVLKKYKLQAVQEGDFRVFVKGFTRRNFNFYFVKYNIDFTL